jgi:hypothetical protein
MNNDFSQCMKWDNLISKMTSYRRDYQGLIRSRNEGFSFEHHAQTDSAPLPTASYPMGIRDYFLRGKANWVRSSSDDWIYYQLVTHSLVITLKYRQYSAISRLHNLQFTIAHTLGFSLSTSHLLATDLNTETITVLHSKYYTQIFSFTEALFHYSPP